MCEVPYRCLRFTIYYSSGGFKLIRMLPPNSISLVNCGQSPGLKNGLMRLWPLYLMYALWNAGFLCPASFKDKPGLMRHSAKVNSVIIFHLLSSGASRMVKKLCLVEIFFTVACLFPVSLTFKLPWLFNLVWKEVGCKEVEWIYW